MATVGPARLHKAARPTGPRRSQTFMSERAVYVMFCVSPASSLPHDRDIRPGVGTSARSPIGCVSAAQGRFVMFCVRRQGLEPRTRGLKAAPIHPTSKHHQHDVIAGVSLPGVSAGSCRSGTRPCSTVPSPTARTSGDQWKRVTAVRGFLRGAELLIMDEPSSALDLRGRVCAVPGDPPPAGGGHHHFSSPTGWPASARPMSRACSTTAGGDEGGRGQVAHHPTDEQGHHRRPRPRSTRVRRRLPARSPSPPAKAAIGPYAIPRLVIDF